MPKLKSNVNGLENLLSSKRTSTSFPKPLKTHCFQCQKNILVKFVIPRFTYSKKNDWYHWTDKSENQGKYICDTCLLNLYRNDKLSYWGAVSDPKKRQVIRTYIHDGTIA